MAGAGRRVAVMTLIERGPAGVRTTGAVTAVYSATIATIGLVTAVREVVLSTVREAVSKVVREAVPKVVREMVCEAGSEVVYVVAPGAPVGPMTETHVVTRF